MVSSLRRRSARPSVGPEVNVISHYFATHLLGSPRSARVRHGMVVALVAALGALAWAQNEPELRVCSDPDAYPVSGRDAPGYENRIAEILADELGFSLTYEWTPIDSYTVRENLHAGECDVVMGALEGAEGILNTLAYHRAPYVFVYAAGRGVEVETLSAEALEGLRVAVPPNGLAHQAVADLGMSDIARVPRRLEAGGAGAVEPLVDAVASGEADVAIVYGPGARQAARAVDAELEVRTVTPEILPPLTRMFRIVTMGLRPEDTALRDALNRALARRWTEVQDVLAEFDVPASSLPQPGEGARPRAEDARVAVVAPFPTSRPRASDRLAESLRIGAEVAESQIAGGDGDGDLRFHLLLANAPTPAAARRSVARLAVDGRVDGIVGGVGTEQARALAEAAEAVGVPFFNVASTDSSVRQVCRPTSFHVQPSAGMYLDGIAEWFVAQGRTKWAIVHAQGELLERARGAIRSQAGAEVVVTVEAPREFADYRSQLDRIRDADADAALVLLPAEAQEFFLGQAHTHDDSVLWTGFPHPVMQTRDAYVRLRQAVGGREVLRVAAWDASLDTEGAREWNEAFASRSGSPMDPTGWATMVAVHTLFAAARELDGHASTATWIETLEQGPAVAQKGEETAFLAGNHQLQQPLYGVRVDPDAPWGRQVSAQEALASVVRTSPALPLVGNGTADAPRACGL